MSNKPFTGANKSPLRNSIFFPSLRLRAFFLATLSAAGDISVAVIFGSGSSLAKARAMAPLPVPISAIRGAIMFLPTAKASSKMISVSGRGIKTPLFTSSVKDQNSLRPVM